MIHDQLDQIASQVTGQSHDLWFWIEDIHLDENSRSLRIPLRANQRDACRAAIVVPDVIAYEIIDTEQIGAYDIESISVSSSMVVVKGNIPIRVNIRTLNPSGVRVEHLQ